MKLREKKTHHVTVHLTDAEAGIVNERAKLFHSTSAYFAHLVTCDGMHNDIVREALALRAAALGVLGRSE